MRAVSRSAWSEVLPRLSKACRNPLRCSPSHAQGFPLLSPLACSPILLHTRQTTGLLLAALRESSSPISSSRPRRSPGSVSSHSANSGFGVSRMTRAATTFCSRFPSSTVCPLSVNPAIRWESPLWSLSSTYHLAESFVSPSRPLYRCRKTRMFNLPFNQPVKSASFLGFRFATPPNNVEIEVFKQGVKGFHRQAPIPGHETRQSRFLDSGFLRETIPADRRSFDFSPDAFAHLLFLCRHGSIIDNACHLSSNIFPVYTNSPSRRSDLVIIVVEFTPPPHWRQPPRLSAASRRSNNRQR